MFKKPKDPRDGIDIAAFRKSIQENGVEATKNGFHIGRERLKAICELEGISIPGQGKPAKEIKDEALRFCKDYKGNYNVGYQRVADAAKRRGISTTEWEMRKAFTNQGLFCFNKPEKKPNEHPHLFVARYAGQLWHADIHYVKIDGQQFYLLGFIDDRSRFLLHYEVLSNKTSDLCSLVLIRALNKIPVRPKMLTIDNGGEFVGDPFQTVLSVYGIEEFRTHPYTPQQNGKIERFWLTIERAKGHDVPWSLQKINELVFEYNNSWSHRSLKKLTQRSTTPSEAWNSMVKYSGQADADIEMIK